MRLSSVFIPLALGSLVVSCAGATGEEVAGASDAVTTPDADADREVAAANKSSAQFEGYFPSPSIVRDGSTYHAWMAKQSIDGAMYNVVHATRTDADAAWKLQDDALPEVGKRVQTSPTGKYAIWAPAVAKIGPRRWVLYYSATLSNGPTAEKKCIWRAHATRPSGPFVDDFDGPIHCQEGSLWTIDPYLVKDAGGDWNLVARVDERAGINTIKIRKLDASGASFAPGSAWSTLTENTPTSWEQPVLENAGMVRLAPPNGGTPHWFVFYTGGAWDGNTYGVGYADCGPSILGPCTKKTVNGPWLHTDAANGVYGPGTPTFYTNEAGEQLMSVQAWKHSGGKKNKRNNGQIMRTYRMTIDKSYKPTAALVRVDE
jgi:hypothetical protein